MTVGETLGLILLVVAATYVLTHVFARVLRRAGPRNDFRALSHWLLVTLVLGGAVAIAVRSAVGAGGAARLPATVPDDVAAPAATALVIAGTVVAASLARKLAADRAETTFAPARAPRRAADVRLRGALAGGVFAGAVVVGAARAGSLPVARRWVPIALALVAATYVIAVYPVQPGWRFAWSTVREPTGEERDRVRECYERFGREPDRIVVYEGTTRTPSVFAVGRILGRILWVHESLLVEADGDDLAVALAFADERARAPYVTAVALAGGLAIGGLGFALAGALRPGFEVVPLVPLAPLAVLVVALCWLAHHFTRTADAFAVEQFGIDAVEGAYERLGIRLTLADWPDWPVPSLLRSFHPDPPIAWRLERLADRSGE